MLEQFEWRGSGSVWVIRPTAPYNSLSSWVFWCFYCPNTAALFGSMLCSFSAASKMRIRLPLSMSAQYAIDRPIIPQSCSAHHLYYWLLTRSSLPAQHLTLTSGASRERGRKREPGMREKLGICQHSDGLIYCWASDCQASDPQAAIKCQDIWILVVVCCWVT